MAVIDNYSLFEAHEARQEREYQRWLDSLPRCSECGKKIEDMHCYNIGGDLFCDDCIDKCRVLTRNYYEEE